MERLMAGKVMSATMPPWPPVRPEFVHVNRYWDNVNQCFVAKILPGEFFVSEHGEAVSTTLGSCISACVRDPFLGIGGMNHFMLPIQGDIKDAKPGDFNSMPSRYGNWAMEYLVNEIMKCGGKKQNLEVKVVGGGHVLSGMKQNPVGDRNIEFVFDWLKCEGFNVVGSDVGDRYPRKVLYFPETGAVRVKKLINVSNETISQRETAYRRALDQDAKKDTGSVELF
jgi:chemotaxis protein CheD